MSHLAAVAAETRTEAAALLAHSATLCAELGRGDILVLDVLDRALAEKRLADRLQSSVYAARRNAR